MPSTIQEIIDNLGPEQKDRLAWWKDTLALCVAGRYGAAMLRVMDYRHDDDFDEQVACVAGTIADIDRSAKSSGNPGLAKEVFQVVFGNTESFEGGTGTHLSYLLGAILCGSGVELYEDDPSQLEFHELIEDTFESDHSVHKYIEFIPAE